MAKRQQAAAAALVEQNTAVQAQMEIDFESDAGKGLETADRDSYAIPFLVVLQPLSPVIVNEEVKGATVGMMMNSVTHDLYGKEAFAVPCAYQRRWIRWAPRESGGGFKGEFSSAQVAEMRASGQVKELDGRLFFPADDGSVNDKKSDRLSDTRSHFLLLCANVDAELGVPMVLALASTGIKASKLLNSRIDAVKFTRANGSLYTPPSFANLYCIKTVLNKNTKGSWWGFDMQIHGAIRSKPLYDQARAFHDSVIKGGVELAHESIHDEAPGGGGGSAPQDERDGF